MFCYSVRMLLFPKKLSSLKLMLYFQIYNKQAATTWNVVKKKMDTKLLLWPQKISYLNRYKLFLYNIVVEYKDAMTYSINIQWQSTVKSKFYILYRSWKIFLDHLKLGYEDCRVFTIKSFHIIKRYRTTFQLQWV